MDKSLPSSYAPASDPLFAWSRQAQGEPSPGQGDGMSSPGAALAKLQSSSSGDHPIRLGISHFQGNWSSEMAAFIGILAPVTRGGFSGWLILSRLWRKQHFHCRMFSLLPAAWMDCLPEGGIGYLPSFPESRPGFVFSLTAAGTRESSHCLFLFL